MKSIVQLLKNNWVILSNALSLVGTLVITSGLGFAFWWLVARRFELVDAGLASASISAMYLLGTFGMLGMGTLLIGELAHHPEKRTSLIATALLISSAGSALIGLVFALLAGTFSSKFVLLTSSWSNLALFVSGVSITSLVLVLDQALLGLLRGHWQMWRNAVFASSKLALLLPIAYYFGSRNAMLVYGTWFLGNILSLVFLSFLLGRNRLQGADFQFQWLTFWEIRTTAASHHILNLSLQASQFAMPVIVTFMLSAEANASFYVAWLIVTSFFVVPSALTQTLYAVSAADLSILAQKIRFTLRTSFLAVIAGCITIMILARHILVFFNPAYATAATTTLQVLLLAAVPVVIRVHYVAIHQIRREVKQAAINFLGIAILELSFAISGCLLGGLLGLSLGWTLAMYIEGALMLPTVYRTAVQSTATPSTAKTALVEDSE